jgi:signal recognition particle subunit SRP72
VNIESAPPPTISSSALSSLLPAANLGETNDPQSKPLTKKTRKSRIPAGVIPGVTPPPDPERWLKKSERSMLQQGKRRKGFGGGGATQGAANVDSSAQVSSTGAISHTPKSGGAKGKKRK